MIVTEQVIVEQQHIDADGCVTDKAVLDWLNHAANTHAKRVGQSYEDIARAGIAWMVMNWKVQYIRRPELGENLTVATWSSAYDRIQAYRDFRLCDASGETVILAASVWVAVDPAKGALLRLTPEIMQKYEGEDDLQSFPGFTFPRYRKLEFELEESAVFTVTNDMIDYNHHVHNSDYLRMLSPFSKKLPEEGYRNIEITYRKEILPGAQVLLEYVESDGKTIVCAREPVSRVVHAILAVW